MGLTGTPKPTFFYPRIIGGGVTCDFIDPAQAILPAQQAIGTENVSADGTRERLHQRIETRVALRFMHLQGELTEALATTYAWWAGHAALGKQSVLVLDQWTPPACTGTLGGAGNVPVGSQIYFVAFVRSGVIFRLSPRFDITVTTSAKQVNLSGVAVGPTGTTARNIYRFGPSGIQFIGPINDNVATLFTDNSADGSLGAQAPYRGTLETDIYNRFFTKAELITSSFAPGRSIPSMSRDLYALELIFRQGT